MIGTPMPTYPTQSIVPTVINTEEVASSSQSEQLQQQIHMLELENRFYRIKAATNEFEDLKLNTPSATSTSKINELATQYYGLMDRINELDTRFMQTESKINQMVTE